MKNILRFVGVGAVALSLVAVAGVALAQSNSSIDDVGGSIFDTVSLDLKVNGQDGPVTVAAGSRIVVSWISEGAARCRGNWSRSDIKSSGTVAGRLSRSVIIKAACIDKEGNRDDDSVVVNVEGKAQIELPSTTVPQTSSSSADKSKLENNFNRDANVLLEVFAKEIADFRQTIKDNAVLVLYEKDADALIAYLKSQLSKTRSELVIVLQKELTNAELYRIDGGLGDRITSLGQEMRSRLNLIKQKHTTPTTSAQSTPRYVVEPLSTNELKAGLNTLYRFKVVAPTSGEIVLPLSDLYFVISKSNFGVSDIALRVYFDSTYSQLSTNGIGTDGTFGTTGDFESTLTNSRSRLVAVRGDSINIPAGATRYFELTGLVRTIPAGETSSISTALWPKADQSQSLLTRTLVAAPTTSAPVEKTYTLTTSVTGAGTVSGTGGVNCGYGVGSPCSTTFTSGTQVTLSASPYTGYTLSEWGSACLKASTGGVGDCTIVMDADKSVSVIFTAQTSQTTTSPITTTPPSLSATAPTISGTRTAAGDKLYPGQMSITATIQNSGGQLTNPVSARFQFSTNNVNWYDWVEVGPITATPRNVSYGWEGGTGSFYYRLCISGGVDNCSAPTYIEIVYKEGAFFGVSRELAGVAVPATDVWAFLKAWLGR